MKIRIRRYELTGLLPQNIAKEQNQKSPCKSHEFCIHEREMGTFGILSLLTQETQHDIV